MKSYSAIRVDIYENGLYPVVSHIFYGRTLREAHGYFHAHMRTDEFLRDAINKQEWNGIPLRTSVYESDGAV